uniref:thrombospondin type-1 domain-containing protein 4 n=1 Tax=Semicossyphus pulcher TaxID=241346 RepID=UPI0037E90FE8
MAGLWQQLGSLWQGRALALLLYFICLLYPPSGALPWDTKASPPPLEIAEIPAGARNISIQETIKSRNYLALRTQTGISIINGNWVIDRPGFFTAVGTQLTYQRPNEIRSRNGDVTPDPGPNYTWKKSAHAECSTTCGTGRRQVQWECVERDSQVTVPADLCDPALQPTNRDEECNTQSCPAYWDVGEWSECSRKCGPGTQQRQVICRQVTHIYANGTETSDTVAPKLCGLSEMPVTKSTCQLKICSQWEMRSEWSSCSVPCGVGQRSREVVCVSNQGDVEEDEECNMNLRPDTLQNCDMGACARSWFTSLWSQRCSADCGQGNRTRATVCLVDHVTDLPLGSCEGERPPEVTTCDSGPCQNHLEWYTGPWSQCSAECGNGTQTRSVACIFNDNGVMEVVDQLKCSSLSQPITAQVCRLKPCGVQWYVTEWSTCSRSCNGGYRVREVRCLADNIAPSERCDPSLTPESREECNNQPCEPEINPSCSDQYHNCVVVVQARLCIYQYYRSVCCASCSQSQKTYPESFQKNFIHR